MCRVDVRDEASNRANRAALFGSLPRTVVVNPRAEGWASAQLRHDLEAAPVLRGVAYFAGVPQPALQTAQALQLERDRRCDEAQHAASLRRRFFQWLGVMAVLGLATAVLR